MKLRVATAIKTCVFVYYFRSTGFSTERSLLNANKTHVGVDSLGVVYLVTCMKCEKQYVGSTVTAFRKGFNNHKSSLIRYGKGQKKICGKHLYSHFCTEGHSGIKDFSVQIIDVTDVNNPTERESF